MTSLWPIYEFRPIVFRNYGTLYRYADGKWLEDDGEYDIAFYGDSIAYGVQLPYRSNILWSWLTRHWSSDEPLHRHGNPWHYALREGTDEWGRSWGRDGHPNTQAHDAAVKACCSQFRCANGQGPQFHLDDPYMTRGLVRERDTKHVVVPPTKPECMYCGLDWLVSLKSQAMKGK